MHCSLFVSKKIVFASNNKEVYRVIVVYESFLMTGILNLIENRSVSNSSVELESVNCNGFVSLSVGGSREKTMRYIPNVLLVKLFGCTSQSIV